MKNRMFLVLGFGVVILGIGFAFSYRFGWWDTPVTEEIHFHAGFQVYLDDVKQDFSNFKYMQVKPCGGDDHAQDEQLEKAHLHDGVGDVVHAHRNGGTWGDLFTNITYQIADDTVGYVNGQLVPQILKMPILANSSVVFFVGENTDIEKKLEDRVTQDHIREVEGKSEDCGTK